MKIKQLKLNGVAFYPKVGVDSIVDAAGTKSAVDTVVTENSINLITSGAVYNSVPTKTSDLTNDSNFVNQSQLSGKQDLLVSGTNIKTINGNSLLSSGNIDVVTDLDDHLDDKSENAIQNKPVAEAIEAIDGRVGALEDAIGDGGSIDERIEETVSAAKSEIKGNATSACDTLGEAEALITAEVSARVNAVSTEVTRAQAAETAILNLYQSLSQSAIEVVDTLPPTGEANKIYRLVGTTNYSDYMYNTDDLTTPILMATYNNAIDNTPIANSANLVTSGGVAEALALGAVYDVSANNPTAGSNNDGKWESISALLSDANLNTLIPISVRKGGMSVKFVLSSDNKYVQYRLMSDSFNTTVVNWQGVDDKPTDGSDNLVKSGGVANKLAELDERTKKKIMAADTVYGFIVVDNAGNIAFRYDKNGFNAAKVHKEFVNVLEGKGVSTISKNIYNKGFYLADINGNIVLRYDKDGLDAAKVSNHFLSLICITETLEKGFYIVDKNHNIGFGVNRSGILTKDILTYEIVK